MSRLFKSPNFVRILALWAYTIPYVGPVVAAALMARANYLDQKRAQLRARQQYNASLKDQLIMTRGDMGPRNLIYGRTVVAGNVVYAVTTGEKKEWLHLVVALGHGEIDAVESLYFNDLAVTWDAAAGASALAPVTSAPYQLARTESDALGPFTVPSGLVVVLPSTPVGGSLFVRQVVNGGGDAGTEAILQAGTDYTLAGATLTFAAPWADAQGVSATWQKAASTGYAWVRWHNGSASQVADAELMAAAPAEWTSAHRLRGVAYLHVRLYYDEGVFYSGLPNIRAVCRGLKVYDPRTTLTAWSENAALITRDYLLRYGMEVDEPAAIASANIADEAVQLSAGPDVYQARYTFGGVVSTGNSRRDNLGMMELALAGGVFYSAGKWFIRAGAGGTPAFTINEDSLADGEINLAPMTSRRDLLNGGKAVFIDAARGWIDAQAPEWSSSTLIAADGGQVLTGTFQFGMVTDSARAQRLVKIAVLRTREAYMLTLPCKLRTYQIACGDLVYVNLARYGLTSKVCRVMDRQFAEDGALVFTLREESQGIYDWALGEAIALPSVPNSTLPDPFTVATPSIVSIDSGDAALALNADGTVRSRVRVTLAPIADLGVTEGGQIELQFRSTATALEWQRVPTIGAATVILIDPAADGLLYEIRVRAINGAGFRSDWAYTTHVVVGKTAPPPLPASFTVTAAPDGTRLLSWEWGAVARPLDLKGVRIRYALGTGLAWDALAPLDADGGFYTNAPVETVRLGEGTYTFGLKTEDTSGNLSIDALLVDGTLPAGPRGALVLQRDEAALGWPGTKTDCTVLGSALEANDVGATWTGLPATWDGWTRWNQNPASPITYQTPNIDLGSAKLVKVVVALTALGSVTIEEQHSDDASTWSSWATVGASYFSTRYVRVRVTSTAGTGAPVPTFLGMTVSIEGPAATIADLQDTSDPNLGATLVRYVQVGAGAVPRSLTAKARERISVKEFAGVVGDGVNDDTAGLQAAIDAVANLNAGGGATGAILEWPPGEYGISGAGLLLPAGKPITMVGHEQGTKLRRIGGGSGYIMEVRSSSVIERLFFRGPASGTSSGILMNGANVARLVGCYFQNQITGVELANSFAVEVESCTFDVCFTYGLIATTAAHNTMVERSNFFTCGVANGGQALRFDVASDNLGIKDNDFEYCNVNIRLNGCNSVEIKGNYLEYHDDACFDFIGTNTGVQIESNWIALGSTVNGGSSQLLQNITGGRFRDNTIFDQSITFDDATLEAFWVGSNRKTGTGTLGAAPWRTPILVNSWAQQTNYTLVGYIKDDRNVVHLRGALVSGTAGTTIFTLPAGYRPAHIAVFATESANGAGRITVNPDGTVVATVAASNNASLDGISFYVG